VGCADILSQIVQRKSCHHNSRNWRDSLAGILSEWELTFLIREERAFPPDCESLEKLLDEAARHCNVKRIRPGRMWKVISRVDSRYPKLGLVNCINQLVESLKKIPCEPQLQIELAVQKKRGFEARALQKSLDLLRGFSQGTPFSPNEDFQEIFFALRSFGSKGLHQSLAKSPNEPELDYNEKLKPQMRFFAWAMVLDIRAQMDGWWRQYSAARDFAQWVCFLNNPAYTQDLSQRFPALIIWDYEAELRERRCPRLRKARYRRRLKIRAKRFNER
jgi:hypothetical protein